MFSIGREHMTEGKTTRTCDVVTGEIVKMPLIRSERAMKPDRVVKADAVDMFALKSTADHSGLAHRVSREIVGGVGEPVPMNERILG